jgi:hypothetical protein
MVTPQRTHREVKNPRISARHLADYMDASETARRTIVRDCKYQSTARVVQHDEAKLSIGRFIRSGEIDATALTEDAKRLRDRLVDSDFERDVLDHNADYIERFATVCGAADLPRAERLAPDPVPPVDLNGVRVAVELQFRLKRTTKTNSVRRFLNMKAACASIAERWPNVAPPPRAVF